MEIKKLYKTPESATPNAALLYDEGEEYPVFLKALHNSVLFPEMLRSGYKLGGLPYDFMKDNISIMELPVEPFNPSDDELQSMYDMLGESLSNDELLKHVDTTVSKGLPMPKANYTITTREAFLAYLDSLETTNSDLDFYPINYFVAPQARFNEHEYIAPENSTYIKIIDNRRRMSLAKFHKLVEWLKGFGLTDNCTFIDVMDAYFAWGLDGLNTPLISKKREEWAEELTINGRMSMFTDSASSLKRYTYGLVNSSGRWIVSKEDKSYNWMTSYTDPKRYHEFISSIAPGKCEIIQLKTPTTKTVITLIGKAVDIQISIDKVVFGGHSHPTVAIRSDVDILQQIPVELALPRNKARLHEYHLMEAIAKYIFDQRKDRRNVSSYKALLAKGVDPENAILYILTYSNMLLRTLDAAPKATVESEDKLKPVRYDAVEDYVAGKPVDENTEQVIQAILNGELNIGATASGKEADGRMNYSDILRDITIIRDVLGFPVKDIYEKVVNRAEGVMEVPFVNGDYSHVLDLRPQSAAFDGMKYDMNEYKLEQADNAQRAMEVKLVAREVCGLVDGNIPEEARPIGVEYYYINCNKSSKDKASLEVNNILKSFEDSYMQAVRQDPRASNPNFVTACARVKRQFALHSWFSVSHRGYYTLPKDLGSTRIDCSLETRRVVAMNTKTGIDSLIAIARSRVYNTFSSEGENRARFVLYCVNAELGVDFVVPTSLKGTLFETPFYAAWCQWTSQQTATLEAAGALPKFHVSWDARYLDQVACGVHKQQIQTLSDAQSLCSYFSKANSNVNGWSQYEQFRTAYNLKKALFPGIYKSEDDDCEETPRLETPQKAAVDVKTARQIDRNTYSESYLDLSVAYSEPDSYIRQFEGFDIETLLLCPDALDKVPVRCSRPVVVSDDNVAFGDTGETMDFTRLPSIGETDFFRHICGRVYVLRTFDEKLWEVRV